MVSKESVMAEWDYKLFWDETISQLRGELGEGEFTIWLSNLDYIRAGETEISVSVPSLFFMEKFRIKYHKRLEEKLRELTGKSISIAMEVIPRTRDDDEEPEKSQRDTKAPEGNSQKNAEPQKNMGPIKISTPGKGSHPQLREDYTFDKYVIGENNKFAANAALAIARNPGDAYNPFLIYGGVGMGKTHLMQAIGNYIHANSNVKVIFITAENFTNEFIESLGVTGGGNKMAAFKNKYRHTDVLLIDDIHFFQDKPGVQEELFYTFNALMDQKKQLAFTCDRPASELKKVHERLQNRFEQGLNVDLQPPLYETRCAILKSTVKNQGIVIPDDVVDLIAKNISSNVRDLISALNKLSAYTKLMNQPITQESAQRLLVDFFSPTKQANMSIELVQRIVAEFFNISHIDLKSKRKPKKIVFPRQIAMYLARDMTDYSLTEIGQAFGGKDHSSVIYSCDKIEDMLRTDPKLEPMLQNLQRQIRESGQKS